MMKGIYEKVILGLKGLSRKLKFNFSKEWFRVIVVLKEEKILDDYLRMCPDPKYNKYGKTLEQRIKNLEKFIVSQEMEVAKKGIHGTVVGKDQIAELTNLDLRNKLFISLKTKLTKYKRADFLILISKPYKHETKDFYFTLRHECIHVLLKQNNLSCKSYKLPSYYWLVEEGLVTYLDFFIDDKLEKMYNYSKQKSWTARFYGKAAIKWLQFLKIVPKKDNIREYFQLLTYGKERGYWKKLHSEALNSRLGLFTN